MTEKTPLIPPRLLEQTTFSASWSFPSVAAVRSLDYDAGRRAGRRRLHLAVFAATMATMSNGFSIGYSSSALPDLRQRMGLSDDQGDWFGSVLNMGAMFGALVGGAAAVLTDRLGRRILLLISLAVSGLSLAAVGAFYHFRQIRDEVSFAQSFGWLPLASLCVFFLGFSVGLRPLAYILMGEMLPLRIRSFAAGTLMCFFYACATLTTKEYHDMLTFFGQDGLFWFYGSIMAAGFVVVMVVLPETKGKSLEEIEQLFGKKQEVHNETG
ncbi:Slc2A8 protein, putative [Ixodes scapularis]|uniref:Slc2A8 protein, putative n=1 Tax=Ixodes scapularis TaxID=6945 RepID=B7PGF3_IXOSC|nr:Slc2A8 protein, putative [Ixodes scapularis]|eukprot:XP_002434275.1 Slc2A8 protein, putative [Ixodes scapularis]